MKRLACFFDLRFFYSKLVKLYDNPSHHINVKVLSLLDAIVQEFLEHSQHPKVDFYWFFFADPDSLNLAEQTYQHGQAYFKMSFSEIVDDLKKLFLRYAPSENVFSPLCMTKDNFIHTSTVFIAYKHFQAENVLVFSDTVEVMSLSQDFMLHTLSRLSLEIMVMNWMNVRTKPELTKPASETKPALHQQPSAVKPEIHRPPSIVTPPDEFDDCDTDLATEIPFNPPPTQNRFNLFSGFSGKLAGLSGTMRTVDDTLKKVQGRLSQVSEKFILQNRK